MIDEILIRQIKETRNELPGIYIIIWLSLYVLSVQSLSPPKPAGLAPQILAGIP
jgi:hypothetical protein